MKIILSIPVKAAWGGYPMTLCALDFSWPNPKFLNIGVCTKLFGAN